MSDYEQTRMMGTPPGATMQMPVGGADAFRTQMGGTTTCAICQAVTPLPEIYCGECGFLLASTPAAEVVLPAESGPVAELVDVANGRRYRLKVGQNTIGRTGTDILVDDGTVSRNHARIMVDNDSVMVEDIGSSNGTKVGDLRLAPNQPVTATHGTPLRFGNWRVMLEMAEIGAAVTSAERTIVTPTDDRTMMNVPPTAEKTVMETQDVVLPEGLVKPPDSATETEAVARLQQTAGPSDDIVIVPGSVTVGRKTGNTVVIPNDSFVSGRHAEFVTDNTGTYLTDLTSTNGTVVNGQKLAPHEPQLLLEGDEIQIGQSRFTFVLLVPDEEEEIARMDYEGDPQPDPPMTDPATLQMQTNPAEHSTVNFVPDESPAE